MKQHLDLQISPRGGTTWTGLSREGLVAMTTAKVSLQKGNLISQVSTFNDQTPDYISLCHVCALPVVSMHSVHVMLLACRSCAVKLITCAVFAVVEPPYLIEEREAECFPKLLIMSSHLFSQTAVCFDRST